MDWSSVIEILKWLVPIGGFGSVAGWFINRTERELKRIRDSHDAYKAMYEDLNQALKEDINEKQEMRKAMSRLHRAINKVFTCRYFPDCPVNVELLRNKADCSTKPKGGTGQRGNPRGSRNDPGYDPGVAGGDGDPGREPP